MAGVCGDGEPVTAAGCGSGGATAPRSHSFCRRRRGGPGADLRSVSAQFVPDLALLSGRADRKVPGSWCSMPSTARAKRRLWGEWPNPRIPIRTRCAGTGNAPTRRYSLVPDVGQADFLSEAAFVADNRVGAITLRPDAAPPHWFRDLLLGGILPDPRAQQTPA